MPQRPNIIFIMTDQMRGDAMGCDGNTFVQTPNLDALAGRGTRFPHAYTATPSCLPARAILWTGMDQWHAGLLGMGSGQGPIPDDYPHTLAGSLTDAGYRTHLIGKAHFTDRALMGFESQELDEAFRGGVRQEYRQWFMEQTGGAITPEDHGVDPNGWQARPWHTQEYLHPTAWTARRAIDLLEQHDDSRPLFLHISFDHPHSPYVPPQAYWDMYRDSTPPPHVGRWAACHDRPEDAVSATAWRGRMTPQQIHRARAGYYGDISFIDAQIGLLMRRIQRMKGREFLANTWFLFTSDHGDMQGDHNLWRKGHPYEGSVRIPLVIAGPGIGSSAPSRRVADEVAELRDVMPTVLEMAGLDCPPTVQGRSLLPLMQSAAADWRPYIHGEHCRSFSAEQEMQYVTDGRQKFIWLPRIGVEQFFDLEDDPGECNNLIDEPSWRTTIEQWRGRLIEELARRDCGWVVDGRLHCPDGPMVSPYGSRRWQGCSQPPA